MRKTLIPCLTSIMLVAFCFTALQRSRASDAIQPLPEEAGDVVLSGHRRADHGPANVGFRLTPSLGAESPASTTGLSIRFPIRSRCALGV